MHKTLLAALVTLACGTANAAIDVYAAELLGVNECGGSPLSCGTFGDPDGYGAASVLIDNLTNEVSWIIQVKKIVLPLTGAHIHQGAAGSNGPVKIDFAASTSGSVVDADAALITPATAAGFYVNLHNSVYTGGAVRGQLMYVKTVNPPVPEPATYGLMLAGLGAVGLLAHRRRKAG